MKKSKLCLLAVFCFFLLLVGQLITAGPIQASNLIDSQVGFGPGDDGNVGEAFGTKGEPDDIRVIVAKVIRVFIGFLGIIMVGFLLYAGFKYMTAGGNSEDAKKALGYIKYTVIGLLIILSAFLLTNFIIDRLLFAVNNQTIGGSVFRMGR